MIAMKTSVNPETRWQRVLARDSRSDGQFVYAVRSTGIYCRPSCPSRRPKREWVEFFARPEQAQRAGYRPCKRCQPDSANPQVAAVKSACEFIQANLDRRLTLAEIAAHLGANPYHFQRLFKKVLGVSPRQFQEARRIERVKAQLRNGGKVTDAIYEAGFGSSSRFYEKAAKALGMVPAQYRNRGSGTRIGYAVFDSPLGTVLIAATARGVCALRLGGSESKLEQDLRCEFSAAVIVRDDAGLETLKRKVVEYLEGNSLPADLPLDVRGTAFQRRVWGLLRLIPHGETHSYGDLAKQIGNAKAARAVARACATNPVALLVPCHRVIQADGGLGGYRWGIGRKAALLKNEQRAARAKKDIRR